MNETDRTDVSFDVHGVKCAAWLYLPPGRISAEVPAVVMAHGLGGVRSWRLDTFAQAFTKAGYACLVFDYRGFGDSDGSPRQVVDPQLALADWRAAIDYARTRQEIDPARIVLFGTSFSGGHVTRLGAEDNRVAAVIAQCPLLDGFASARTTDPVRGLRLMVAAVRDLVAARLGRPPVLVDIGGPWGSRALVPADDADFAALIPQGVHSETRVAARIAVTIMTYRPGRSAARITCPILYILCENDRMIPLKSSLRHARRAPHGEVHVVPYGHFDIYRGKPYRDNVATQLNFLARTVPVDATAHGETAS